MTAPDNPFPLPEPMSPALMRVLSYWRDLKRGDNDMPFWDDVNLSVLPDLADRLMLINVFAKPERFRFNVVGEAYGDAAGDLANRFADEVELAGRLGFLRAQASATVEAAAPTFYAHAGAQGFSRLLAPMWGDGHIGMLLGALELR